MEVELSTGYYIHRNAPNALQTIDSPMSWTRHLTKSDVAAAVRILQAEQTLVFPTETVYGLGADARSHSAISRVFALKGRPADNPLIVHVGSIEDAARYVALGAEERSLFERFSPGPISLVARSLGLVDPAVSAGLETVAVRIPAHPVARRLLEAFAGPIAAPSANRSGRPSPTDYASALREMDGLAAGILDGGPCVHGLESTVVRVQRSDRKPMVEILRPGAVTAEMIMDVTGLSVRAAEPDRDDPARTAAVHGRPNVPADRGAAVAPGTRYVHYRPNARVVLLREGGGTTGAGNSARYGVIALASTAAAFPVPFPSGAVVVEYMPDLATYAARLYAFFFACEAAGCSTIYCELPPARGIGVALQNRLKKAAGP